MILPWLLQLNNSDLGCYVGNSPDPIGCSIDLLIAGAQGEFVLGLMLGGGLMVGFYNAGGGSLAAPSVLVALIGGILFPLLPASLTTVATTLMFLGLVGAILTLLKKYVMQPGT